MGAFKDEESPKGNSEEKGYRLRDTDDRLTRLKIDTEKTRPVAEMLGAATYGNGISLSVPLKECYYCRGWIKDFR